MTTLKISHLGTISRAGANKKSDVLSNPKQQEVKIRADFKTKANKCKL